MRVSITMIGLLVFLLFVAQPVKADAVAPADDDHPPCTMEAGGHCPRPFPPPVPDPTGYCNKHICSLWCIRDGEDGGEDANLNTYTITDTLGLNASSLALVVNRDNARKHKLPFWGWRHGAYDDSRNVQWASLHLLDKYYGQDLSSWVCAPYSAIIINAIKGPFGGHAHT